MINALRAHLAELGIASAQGREGLKELLKIVASDADERLPADAHASLVVLRRSFRRCRRYRIDRETDRDAASREKASKRC